MAKKQVTHFNPGAVRRALVAWHDLPALGQHPFAGLAVVTGYRLRQGLPDNPRGRGLALRGVLREAIERLKPSSPYSPTAEDWRHYNILYEQYIDRRTTASVAESMGITQRTYFREQGKALEQLCSFLWEMEEAETIPIPATMDAVPRVERFVGRQAELAFYEDQLNTHHVAVVAGLFGVGKTALAAEIAARRQAQGNVIWLTLREGMIAGVDTVLQEISLHLAELGHAEYSKVLLLEGKARQRQSLNVKINYLVSALEQDHCTLCFDNVELVLGSPEITSFLEILWDRARRSGALSLLLVGRERPALATGVQFRALEGLNPADARAFLNQMGLAALPESLFQQLYEKTRGNPMLLELFSGWVTQQDLTLTTPEAVQAIQRLVDEIWRQPDIADHLLRQVYQTLDGPSRRFIEFASVFREPFDDEDEAIVGILAEEGVTDIKTILDGLVRLHLATRLSGGWAIAIHPVIRGYFYSRLKSQLEFKRRLHARVAWYYEEKRRGYVEAAHHWYESGQYNHAAQTLLAHVDGLLYAGEGHRMLEVLNRFAPGQLDGQLWPSVWLARGDALAFTGEADPAVQAYQESLALLNAEPPSPQRQEQIASICHKIGRVFRSDNLPQAMTWYERGLAELGEPGKDSVVAAGIYIDGSGVLYQQGRYEDSLTWCRQGLDILGSAGPPFWLAQGENFLGHVYYSQGRCELALQHFQKGLDISRQANDAYHIAMSYSNLANACLAQGDWTEALRLYQESVKIKERIGDIMGLAVTFFNLGSLYTKRGDDALALSHLEKSMDIWTRTRSDYGIGATHMNLALVHLHRAEWDSAEAHLRQSLGILQRVAGHHYLPEVLRLLAQLRLGQGQLTKAVRWATRSLKYGEELNMRREVAMTCQVLGQVHTARRDWAKAHEFLERSLALAQELKDLYTEGQAHYHLALLILAMAEAGVAHGPVVHTEARAHLERAVALFARLEAKRELARAQAALALILTGDSR